MPSTKLIPVKIDGKEESFFAIQRFDRIGNKKVHTISLAGMLELTHRAPSIDYTNLLKAVLFVTKDVGELEKAFRLMVFNVLAHNKDDHTKNFSFILEDRVWTLSPAYDLTFSSGMNNQHMTAVQGEGQPSFEAIERVAKELSITKWREIVDEVFKAVSSWPNFAQEANIPKNMIEQYQKAMRSSPCYQQLTKY